MTCFAVSGLTPGGKATGTYEANGDLGSACSQYRLSSMQHITGQVTARAHTHLGAVREQNVGSIAAPLDGGFVDWRRLLAHTVCKG